jgi:hypothetical protein
VFSELHQGLGLTETHHNAHDGHGERDCEDTDTDERIHRVLKTGGAVFLSGAIG